jgi:hypothetical protein
MSKNSADTHTRTHSDQQQTKETEKQKKTKRRQGSHKQQASFSSFVADPSVRSGSCSFGEQAMFFSMEEVAFGEKKGNHAGVEGEDEESKLVFSSHAPYVFLVLLLLFFAPPPHPTPKKSTFALLQSTQWRSWPFSAATLALTALLGFLIQPLRLLCFVATLRLFADLQKHLFNRRLRNVVVLRANLLGVLLHQLKRRR